MAAHCDVRAVHKRVLLRLLGFRQVLQVGRLGDGIVEGADVKVVLDREQDVAVHLGVFGAGGGGGTGGPLRRAS